MTTHPTPPDQTEGKNGEMPETIHAVYDNYGCIWFDQPNPYSTEYTRADLASPAQPVRPDQTAAAQEREATSFWVIEKTERNGNGSALYWDGGHSSLFVPDINKAIQFHRREDAMWCAHQRVRGEHAITEHMIFSTQQPEPCVDELEALKEEIWKRCPKTPSMWEAMVYNGKIPDWINDAFKARGLLTGRTEAKAVERIDGLAEAIRVSSSGDPFEMPTIEQAEIVLKAASEWLRLQEAEAKAEGDMVLTDAMIRAGVNKAMSTTISGDYRWPDYIRDLYITMQAYAPRTPVVSTAPPVQQEQDRLRDALFMCASGCQGGHSDAGAVAAEVLGIPFPVSMENLWNKATEEGRDAAKLWPWYARSRQREQQPAEKEG